MSKRAEYTGAAIGFVAGVGLALLFLVWSYPGFRNPTYQSVTHQSAQHDDGPKEAEKGDDKPQWREWGERLIILEDTPAQWLMAVFAVFATGLSFWAIRLVRDTLTETQKTANAAIDTLHSTRAWMVFEFGHIVPIFNRLIDAQTGEARGISTGYRAEMTWKNAGESPAVKARPVTIFKVIRLGEPIPHFDAETMASNDPELDFATRQAVVGKGMQIMTYSPQFFEADFFGIKNNFFRLIVYCKAEYRDIFKPDIARVTEGCWLAEFSNMETRDGMEYPIFVFNPVGPQNTVS
jgi:hypothetical protein